MTLNIGYGYETLLDWVKDMVTQSYLKREVITELVRKIWKSR